MRWWADDGARVIDAPALLACARFGHGGAGLVERSTRLTASEESGSWPQFGHDGANTGHPLENEASLSDATELATGDWSFDRGSAGGSAPVVADGDTFARETASPDGFISVVSPPRTFSILAGLCLIVRGC
ncbi:hypothetical protein [Halapricum desulfuricans]|uniref:Uncharacterized protein n=1 Tax=Halapricum desulfuricans TaxID=2841257 RepID=A0A897MXJ4_9EURY|nr:hypothetical protein [Halapricum desulfuricans]QSG04708.1 hypothetical protein HSR121_0352 [Halapricum desulfuricans]